jgi:hypothetical protein
MNNIGIVVMTTLGRVSHCEKIVHAQQPLESTLLDRLIEFLNTEIAIGTVVSLAYIHFAPSQYMIHEQLRID